jgi:hypothetical protein
MDGLCLWLYVRGIFSCRGYSQYSNPREHGDGLVRPYVHVWELLLEVWNIILSIHHDPSYYDETVTSAQVSTSTTAASSGTVAK